MAKKIYPGNYVNRLSSYQGQPVVAIPGRVYYHITGYALVGSTGATSFDVTIPSPDRRADDKPRASITGLVVPVGAKVYDLGIRVPDMRKDRGVGTAFSGLVGTNTNRIKLASAVGTVATGEIIATALGTDSSAVAIGSNLTVAPVQSNFSLITPVAITGSPLTLKVYVTTSAGTAAGSNLTSTAPGGTPIIVEVGYYLEDDVADLGDVTLPFITEN
ncbi:MAG: hypothetical protein ACO4AL_12175 [Steroidobacteraceae bacterium]